MNRPLSQTKPLEFPPTIRQAWWPLTIAWSFIAIGNVRITYCHNCLHQNKVIKRTGDLDNCLHQNKVEHNPLIVVPLEEKIVRTCVSDNVVNILPSQAIVITWTMTLPINDNSTIIYDYWQSEYHIPIMHTYKISLTSHTIMKTVGVFVSLQTN